MSLFYLQKREYLDDLDLLLGNLVTTYSKLRQVPKFFNKLLDALCTSDSLETLHQTSGFNSRYCTQQQSSNKCTWFVKGQCFYGYQHVAAFQTWLKCYLRF